MQPLAMAAATACMCHRKRLRCHMRAEASNAPSQNWLDNLSSRSIPRQFTVLF